MSLAGQRPRYLDIGSGILGSGPRAIGGFSNFELSFKHDADGCFLVDLTLDAFDEQFGALKTDLVCRLRNDRELRPEQIGSRYIVEHDRSEEHTSELQSRRDLVCRLLLEK